MMPFDEIQIANRILDTAYGRRMDYKRSLVDEIRKIIRDAYDAGYDAGYDEGAGDVMSWFNDGYEKGFEHGFQAGAAEIARGM